MGGTVEAYVASVPAAAQDAFAELRRIIRDALPGCAEKVSYGVLGFAIDGKAVAYAGGYKSFVSMYPVPELAGPEGELVARYRAGKGTMRFPLDEPLPEPLIRAAAIALAKRR
ncbi:MAG: iron chaperone [Candidatus Nanopelagicales bacterium]